MSKRQKLFGTKNDAAFVRQTQIISQPDSPTIKLTRTEIASRALGFIAAIVIMIALQFPGNQAFALEMVDKLTQLVAAWRLRS